MFRLDNNVVSELRRIRLGRADANVARWADSVEAADLYLHVPDPRPVRAGLIAGTALVHGMTVVTRNIGDFAPMDAPLLNPWAA